MQARGAPIYVASIAGSPAWSGKLDRFAVLPSKNAAFNAKIVELSFLSKRSLYQITLVHRTEH